MVNHSGPVFTDDSANTSLTLWEWGDRNFSAYPDRSARDLDCRDLEAFLKLPRKKSDCSFRALVEFQDHYFDVAQSTFCVWRDRYRDFRDDGLKSRRSSLHNHPNKTADEVVEKILQLRRTYQVGPIRIAW